MVTSGSKFTVKPKGTNPRPILIAYAMRYESFVCDGHKIFRKCTVFSANCKGILTDRPLTLKPDVL